MSKSFPSRKTVFRAMFISDPLAWLQAIAGVAPGGEGDISLKPGEVAFGGLNKPMLRIFDPRNPSHFVICKNNLAYFGKYVAHNNDTVYMNYRDAGYFRILGFVAGDTVHIVEES